TTIIASTACFTASSSEATGHFEINAFSLDLSPRRAHISRGSHHKMQNPAYCVPCMVLARRRAARARGGCAGNRDDLDVDRKLVLQDWRPSHCPGRIRQSLPSPAIFLRAQELSERPICLHQGPGGR